MSFSGILPVVRLAAFGVASAFSLIVLALCAHLIAFTNKWVATGSYFPFSALGIATALLTLLTLPSMIVIDIIRKGAITSFIIVELGWISFLWVLWLATAALTSNSNGTGGNCNFLLSAIRTACGEIQAIEAFSFLIWLALLAYTGILLVSSILATTRGHSVWTSSVKTANFDAPAANTTNAPQQYYGDKPQDGNVTYPPQGQCVGQEVPTQYTGTTASGQPALPHPAQSAYPQV